MLLKWVTLKKNKGLTIREALQDLVYVQLKMVSHP
jgi:hypothetical protein